MESDRDRLLNELRNFKPTPPIRHIADRVRALNQALEGNPPENHGYIAISIVMAAATLLGFLFIVGSLIGFGVAAMPSGLEARYDETQRLVILGISIGAAVLGFILVLNGQLMKLFLDLQENADRQSFALHGIFYLLMSERKDPIDEPRN